MLEGDEFKVLDSDRTRAALKTAEEMKLWIEQHKQEGSFFQQQIPRHFNKCLQFGVDTTVRREKMLGKFYHLQTSKEFVNFWKVLLREVGPDTTTDPIFFQHVAQHMFNSLLRDMYPLPDHTSSTSTAPAMSSEETNALRYVAGYVCAKLHQKMAKSPRDRCLCSGIEDMMEDEEEEDYEDDEDSKGWIDIIDRGGLFRVSNMVYALFLSIEMVVRTYFQVKRVAELRQGMIGELETAATNDEDVQLHWSTVGVELPEADREALLSKIVNIYVTLRGFSFAATYLELYKQWTKQSLQKKRALRAKVGDSKKKRRKKAVAAVAAEPED